MKPAPRFNAAERCLDSTRLELALIENLQREDLNPMETATAYAKLKAQFNMTIEQMSARAGGKSTEAISNYMRLLQLPEFAKQAIADRVISKRAC